MKLTLNELKYIISESYRQLINEIKVKDAYNKHYQNIPEHDFKKIVDTLQRGNDTLLPETKWALKLYQRKSPRFMEDLYKLRNDNGDGYLDIFIRAKERRMLSGVQSDLNQYKSIADLGKFIDSLDYKRIMGRTKGEISNAVHDAKDDIEVLYEDSTWKVLIPKTHEASCYWAQGAHWCTAYRDDDEWFNKYSSEGPLYMIVNKLNVKESIQFHIPSRQYMDFYDYDIKEPVLGNVSPKLLDVLKRICDEYSFIKLTGINIENGHRIMKDGNTDSFGIIDENGKAVTNMEYQLIEVSEIPNILLVTKKIDGEKLSTLINWDGKIICDEWFNKIYEWKNGIGIIWKYKNRTKEVNAINSDGKILFKEWYADVWFMIDGIMVCKKIGERIEPSPDEYLYGPSYPEDVYAYNKYTLDGSKLKGEWTEKMYEAQNY